MIAERSGESSYVPDKCRSAFEIKGARPPRESL
jgi:hypothetical protein